MPPGGHFPFFVVVVCFFCFVLFCFTCLVGSLSFLNSFTSDGWEEGGGQDFVPFLVHLEYLSSTFEKTLILN